MGEGAPHMEKPWPPPFSSWGPLSFLLLLFVHQALVALADLAIRNATLLPIHVDFVELLCLLHKDEPFVKWFMQLHCRLPSALH